MLGVSLAVSISRRISRLSVVEQQMIDEGYVEAEETGDPLAHVTAADVMTPMPATLSADENVEDALARTISIGHRSYPVVEGEQRLAGIVTRQALSAAVRDGGATRAIREVMEKPRLVATDREPILQLIKRMGLQGVDRCPVIQSASGAVVGFVSPSDILRARMRAIAGNSEREFEFFE
jgi:CIC family chloride channel protein